MKQLIFHYSKCNVFIEELLRKVKVSMLGSWHSTAELPPLKISWFGGRVATATAGNGAGGPKKARSVASKSRAAR